uniref:C2 domain-containing protein n=1 Tax=Setaria digitata TaxID=48799 RepID=A0A915Q822_9BILA
MSSSLLKSVFRRESGEGKYQRLKKKGDTWADEVDSMDDTSTRNDEKCDDSTENPKPEAYVTFSVRICLKEGHNLAIRDASGSSDPYVKFKYKGRIYFKSSIIYKNLNPVWEEEFTLLIDDPTTPICIDVYDYDRWAADDYMGGAIIDLSQLRLFQMTIMKLKLSEEGNDENMGEIDVVVTISPLTAHEKDEFLKAATRGIICERPKRIPQKMTQVWTSIVNIALIEGRNLTMPDGFENNIPDPFVKFKLGNEKYKSRPVVRSNNPKWLEQFDLHMFDEPKHMLEMMVIDKKTNKGIGRCSLNLDKLEKETPNQLICELDRGAGSILVLISVTGTSSTDAVIDLSDFAGDDIKNAIIDKYAIFRARNLASVDAMNKSNPFVVVELVNALLQTHTEYKTVNPEWNKIFTFAVKDIHAILEITVYDEDPNKKAEFLGKVAIPLLQIRNCESKWYALKDRKLKAPAKGQVLLEMDVIWNPIRAAIRTFTPRERKYIQADPKFKRRLFMSSYARLREFLLVLVQVRDYVHSCFDWDSPVRSSVAFVLFVVFVYFFHIHHIPVLLLLLFLRPHKKGRNGSSKDSNSGSEDEPDANEMSGQPLSTSSSIRERFNSLQDTMAKVQNTMDFIASLLERIRNTFNFTQPYLSTLAVVTLSIITVLLYFVPLRWIIMIWGQEEPFCAKKSEGE